MPNDSKQKMPPWILIVLFFCWPVGLVCLIYWFSQKDKAGTGNPFLMGKILMIFGYILLGFAGIELLSFLGQVDLSNSKLLPFSFTMVVVFLVLAAGGVALLVAGSKQKKLRSLYDRYVPCILNSRDGSILQVASMLGCTADQVLADIHKLLGKGALAGAYIDQRSWRVVLIAVRQNVYAAGTCEPCAVICPHCGGKNVVTGEGDIACDFCDMPIDR